MASTYLTRTAGSTGNVQIWTFSAWIKRSRISNADATQILFGTYTDANNRLEIGFHNANNFIVKEKQSSSTNIDMTTSELLKDPSAWYNLVVAVDTTQATASNRVKMYINGSQITTWQSGYDNYPNQNYNTLANVSGRTYVIGQEGNNQYYFDGSMSHVHFVDGTAYPASTFGSTDSVTGEWSINTSPSITMGTNGFTILKDGNTITDQSSNSNNLTVAGGTLTNTEDSPSNNFATLNPLNYQLSGCTLAQGNTSLTATGGNGWRTFYGTLAASSGKFYWEQKVNSYSGSSHYIGISDIDKMKNSNDNDFESASTDAYCYRADGGKVSKNTLTAGAGASFGAGNIIGIAMDLVNNKLYFSKDGVWQNSGDPTSGASGTGSFFNITAGKLYTPATATYNTSNQFFSYNFGNGSFGTTAVTTNSGNGYAGAEGSSIFNYQPPTGYSALSTKGLNL